MKNILPINQKLLTKIKNLCSFNSLELYFEQGNIHKLTNTNINLITPHSFTIKIADILLIILCYDNLHLYLYDRTKIITIQKLEKIIKNIKNTR